MRKKSRFPSLRFTCKRLKERRKAREERESQLASGKEGNVSSPRTMRFFFAMEDDVRPETLFRISSQMLDEEEVEEDDVVIRNRERERESEEGAGWGRRGWRIKTRTVRFRSWERVVFFIVSFRGRSETRRMHLGWDGRVYVC